MGVQQVLLAAGTGGVQTTVTVASNAGGAWGFLSSGAGSISPVITAPYTGNAIIALYSVPTGGTGPVDFGFTITGAYSGGKLGAFSQIVVQSTAGGNITYLASAATYSGSFWSWGTGSSPAWTAAGNRILTIS